VGDATLEVGGATETIEVSSDSQEVQTTSSQINNNYDSKSDRRFAEFRRHP